MLACRLLPALPCSDADALAYLGKKGPAAIAEDAEHAELAQVLHKAAAAQMRDQAAAAARHAQRQEADAKVEAMQKELLYKEDDEVEAIEAEIVSKKLGLERMLSCCFRPPPASTAAAKGAAP